MATSDWHVYIVRCQDKTLYTGVTTDVTRRIDEHNGSAKGARYTRARRPVELVWSEAQLDRSGALKREAAIKKMSRVQKERLIQAGACV